MAQRPVLTSLFAVAVAAAAVRASSGPSTPTGSLGATLAGGAATHQTRSAGVSGQPSWGEQLKRDPEEAGRNAAREELRTKVCDFVAGSPEVCPKLAGVEGAGRRGAMYPAMPKVMIAIAPNPVETRLGLLFDRMIDVFEDALQDSGWEYQGNWMPWPSGGEGSQGSTDFDQREQEKLFVTGRQKVPGALFFRPADRRFGGGSSGSPQREPMIVFVVGDSPTNGVDAEPFREALRMFAALTPKGEPLQIMGPDFTGAGPSLRSLLNEAKGTELEGRAVRVASGSVSDWRCDHVLPNVSARTTRGDDCGSGADSFVSFGADQEWQTQRTREYLMEHSKLRASEIALLTEDESGYGSLNRQIPLVERGKKGKDTDPPDDFLRLTFPRGISRLRSAYQKNAVWGFGGSSGASSVNLSLDFEEPQHATDSVPVFAQRQMPVSQEGSMGQLAAILEEHQVRAVLLNATDVIDELFVAQMLARRAPNVMLIVRGTDVLFLRSGDGGGYHNVYAVSPWPLIPRNQSWSRSQDIQPLSRAFASGDAEGIYTATRYLVGERTDELQDYSSPLESTGRPPLWLSLIGHGAYWPVALIDSAQSDRGTAENGPVERSQINLPHIPQHGSPMSLVAESMPISQRLAILLAVFVCLLHAGKCMNLPMLARILPRYQISEEATRRPKLALQLGLTAVAALMLCLVYEPVERLQPGDGIWRLLFLLALGSLSLCGAWLLWRILRERTMSMTVPISPAGAGVEAMLFQVVAGGLICWGAYWVWESLWLVLPGHGSRGEGLREFFFFRSQHPLSGASPVFPLLIALLGVLVVLFSHLGRLTFTPMVAPLLPESTAGIPNCPGNQSVQLVNGLLVWPIPGQGWREKLRKISRKLLLFAVVVVACLTVTRAMKLAPEMLEGLALQWVLRASTFVVLVGLCWDLVMASVLWTRLKVSLLDPLESSPLRRGFSSIRGLTWKSLWLMPQSISAQYRAMLRAMDQTTRRVMDGAAKRVFDGESLRESSDRMWKQFEGGGTAAQVVESFGEVQKRMAKVGEDLLINLKAAWRQEVERVTVPDWRRTEEDESENGRTPDKSKAPGAVQQIAEEWVALLYIHYIRLVLIQIRSRLSTAALLYLLLVWSVTCYPFMNRHVMIIALSALLGVLAFVVTSTYASINRDSILSRTTESQPGKLDFDFYVKTASMVGIPLLGFMASQFPEVSSFLFSWIEPGVAAVK